jgi:branched-chain amino acid transport system substrate-binding protein
MLHATTERGFVIRGISRRLLINGIAALSSADSLAAASAFARVSGEPITIGVSGPLTGQNVQYGAQWKKGSDLALEQVNKTGLKGRPAICFRGQSG